MLMMETGPEVGNHGSLIYKSEKAPTPPIHNSFRAEPLIANLLSTFMSAKAATRR
jgi:hypothetical protein